MNANEEWHMGEQVKGTRVEKTNIGYAIFIELQEKTIKIEFRDEAAFDFVDQLEDQAQEARAGEKA